MGNIGDKLRNIQWDISALPVFEKNFYIEHPAVTKRDEQSAEQWRKEQGITVIGRGVPKPVFTFDEASMPEYVLKEVLKQGFTAREFFFFFFEIVLQPNMCFNLLCFYLFILASPIQSQGWPMALLGRDMIGISATGSGKTLAFLLPAMIHINAQVCLFFLFFFSCVMFKCLAQ